MILCGIFLLLLVANCFFEVVDVCFGHLQKLNFDKIGSHFVLLLMVLRLFSESFPPSSSRRQLQESPVEQEGNNTGATLENLSHWMVKKHKNCPPSPGNILFLFFASLASQMHFGSIVSTQSKNNQNQLSQEIALVLVVAAMAAAAAAAVLLC
jgi:hypothetical protein